MCEQNDQIYDVAQHDEEIGYLIAFTQNQEQEINDLKTQIEELYNRIERLEVQYGYQTRVLK